MLAIILWISKVIPLDTVVSFIMTFTSIVLPLRFWGLIRWKAGIRGLGWGAPPPESEESGLSWGVPPPRTGEELDLLLGSGNSIDSEGVEGEARDNSSRVFGYFDTHIRRRIETESIVLEETHIEPRCGIDNGDSTQGQVTAPNNSDAHCV